MNDKSEVGPLTINSVLRSLDAVHTEKSKNSKGAILGDMVIVEAELGQ